MRNTGKFLAGNIFRAKSSLKKCRPLCAACLRLYFAFRNCRVDILLIDTGGYDLEVLKLAKLELLLPRLVVFEHINLSRDDYREAVRLLRKERYQLWKDHSDTVGVLSRRRV